MRKRKGQILVKTIPRVAPVLNYPIPHDFVNGGSWFDPYWGVGRGVRMGRTTRIRVWPDDRTVYFGSNYGKLIQELPTWYLIFILLNNNKQADGFFFAIEHEFWKRKDRYDPDTINAIRSVKYRSGYITRMRYMGPKRLDKIIRAVGLPTASKSRQNLGEKGAKYRRLPKGYDIRIYGKESVD